MNKDFGNDSTLSPKSKLLILVVLVGLILFAVLYYLVGIGYSYVIRYPILIATIILFIVAMAILVVVMSKGIRAPLPRANAFSHGYRPRIVYNPTVPEMTFCVLSTGS